MIANEKVNSGDKRLNEGPSYIYISIKTKAIALRVYINLPIMPIVTPIVANPALRKLFAVFLLVMYSPINAPANAPTNIPGPVINPRSKPTVAPREAAFEPPPRLAMTPGSK